MRHLYLFETPYLFLVLGQQLLFLLWENGDVGKEIIMMMKLRMSSRARNPLALSIWLMAERQRRGPHTHARLFASYIAHHVCPLRKEKRWIEIFFPRVTQTEIQSICGIIFFFPRLYLIWKKGGCHGDGMSESIPDDVFNISRRSKCQKWARINDRREGSTWFLIQKGRNHLRLLPIDW